MEMPENNETPLFHRTGVTHPLGKLTFQLKVDLPEEVGEAMVVAARELGIGLAELTRERLSWDFCRDRMQSLQDRRNEVMQGNGPGYVPEKA